MAYETSNDTEFYWLVLGIKNKNQASKTPPKITPRHMHQRKKITTLKENILFIEKKKENHLKVLKIYEAV